MLLGSMSCQTWVYVLIRTCMSESHRGVKFEALIKWLSEHFLSAVGKAKQMEKTKAKDNLRKGRSKIQVNLSSKMLMPTGRAKKAKTIRVCKKVEWSKVGGGAPAHTRRGGATWRGGSQRRGGETGQALDTSLPKWQPGDKRRNGGKDKKRSLDHIGAYHGSLATVRLEGESTA